MQIKLFVLDSNTWNHLQGAYDKFPDFFRMGI